MQEFKALTELHTPDYFSALARVEDPSIVSRYSSAQLSHCVIEKAGRPNNWYGVRANVFNERDGTLAMTDCIVQGATGYGVYFAGGSATILNGALVGNSTAAMFNATDTAVAATNNWWGDASGPYDPSLGPPDINAAGRGDPISDYVSYRPWSTSPPPGVAGLLPPAAPRLTSPEEGEQITLPEVFAWGPLWSASSSLRLCSEGSCSLRPRRSSRLAERGYL